MKAALEAAMRALSPNAAPAPQTNNPAQTPIPAAAPPRDPCAAVARKTIAVSTPGVTVSKPAAKTKAISATSIRRSHEAEQVGHDVFQEARLLTAGRGGLRHEVEHLAVLHAVIGDSRNLAALVEIEREHMLIGGAGRHEGERAVLLLADVVPGVAADRRRRRRRAHQVQRLALVRFSDLHLGQRLLVDLIAAVEIAVVANAAAQRKRQSQRRERHFPNPAHSRPHCEAALGLPDSPA